MKRLVQLVGRTGVTYDVPMTAEEAAFFLRLTELKAKADPTITFQDVVIDWIEKRVRDRGDPSARQN